MTFSLVLRVSCLFGGLQFFYIPVYILTIIHMIYAHTGLILAAYIAFPIYFFLEDRFPIHIFGQTVFPLALLLAAIGFTWYIISLTLTPLIIRYQNKLLATL